ncbi:transcriptional regulator [Plantibacter sp. VKM Ac-2880]|nr:transcriptional regulator [Plantibacter sp. VKM Ac-2880]
MKPERSASNPRDVNEAFGTLPRLKVTAFLSGCDEAEFAVIAAATGVAASALSKASSHLEELGYLKAKKGHVGKRPRTWLRLTDNGREAFERHLRALEALTAIAGRASEPAQPADS